MTSPLGSRLTPPRQHEDAPARWPYTPCVPAYQYSFNQREWSIFAMTPDKGWHAYTASFEDALSLAAEARLLIPDLRSTKISHWVDVGAPLGGMWETKDLRTYNGATTDDY